MPDETPQAPPQPPQAPAALPEPEITLEEWIAASQSCCGVGHHNDE